MLDWERDIYKNNMLRMELVEVLEKDKAQQSQRIKATGYEGEELEVIRVQSHGLTSWPSKGALGFGVSIQGRRDLAMAFGFESPKERKPFEFKQGGTQLYDAKGQHITLDNDKGVMEFKGPVTITINGKLKFKVTGDVVIENSGKILLGADDPGLPKVITEAGPSEKVRAKVPV